jgi:hypothetical protein
VPLVPAASAVPPFHDHDRFARLLARKTVAIIMSGG